LAPLWTYTPSRHAARWDAAGDRELASGRALPDGCV
jgi:hypothetical protein